MKRPKWLKRRMPVNQDGYILCADCQKARFLSAYVPKADKKTTCAKHRTRRLRKKRGKMLS